MVISHAASSGAHDRGYTLFDHDEVAVGTWAS